MKQNRILLVEDEKKLSSMLSFGLSEHAYSVQVADDGPSALNLYKSSSYNLVLLDVNLPGINGYEICRKIRKTNTDIPIVMLTALSTLSNKIEGYKAGADDYISKPFEFKELVMKINVLVKRSKNNRETKNILQAGDLQMNLDKKEVIRGNTIINLTSKEFQLLEYLVVNKNKMLSRSNIAMNVWEIDFDTNTNIIDVYINYLRKKVDKNFSKKLIHTHVGMGYILKDK